MNNIKTEYIDINSSDTAPVAPSYALSLPKSLVTSTIGGLVLLTLGLTFAYGGYLCVLEAGRVTSVSQALLRDLGALVCGGVALVSGVWLVGLLTCPWMMHKLSHKTDIHIGKSLLARTLYLKEVT